MTGAAERFRGITDDVTKIVGDTSPIYSTSSGFRSAFDPSVSGDAVDMSVVAQHIGVLIRPAIESGLPEPRPLVLPPTEVANADQAKKAGETGKAQETNKTDAADLEQHGNTMLLASPAMAAGNERARQAWAALTNSWFDEAERLFIVGAKQTPTDAYMWFGAGLAASAIDRSRAADHLLAASRYLLPEDPPGAAYAAIMAASLKEAAGEISAARDSLLARFQELDRQCPVLSLHLARLGPDRKNRVGEALLADPMLEADVVALGFDPTGELARQRRLRTERELAIVDLSITELRRLGEVAAVPDDPGNAPEPTRPAHEVAKDRLSLVQLEVDLWRKVTYCRRQITRVETLVRAKKAERRQREAELEALITEAEADLDSEATLSFFAVSMTAAIAAVVVHVGSQQMAASAPNVGSLIVSLAFVFEIVLLFGWVGHSVVTTLWPRRRFRRARLAKQQVPQYQLLVNDLREAEFAFSRQYRLAAHAAEHRLQRVLDRRNSLIPARPQFERSVSNLKPPDPD